MGSSPYPKRTCFFVRWERHWEINKIVRYLLENFTKWQNTCISFFSNLTVCCICIYCINYTNCECDRWNFLSSCLHDLWLRLFWWNIVIVDQPVKAFLNTPRRQEEQDLKAKKSVIWRFMIGFSQDGMPCFLILMFSSKMGLKPERSTANRNS